MKLISETIHEYRESSAGTRKVAGALQRQQNLSTERLTASKLEGRLQKLEASKRLRRVKKLMDTREFNEQNMRRKRIASTKTMRKMIMSSQENTQNNQAARIGKLEQSMKRRMVAKNR